MTVMYWLRIHLARKLWLPIVLFSGLTFAAMPAMNFAAAFSTFVGQNLGANKPHRIKTGLIATFRMTSLLAVTISIINIVFCKKHYRFFTSDAEGKDRAEYLIVSPFYITFTAMFAVGGVMRVAGDTRKYQWSLVSTLCRDTCLLPASKSYGAVGI